MNKNSCHLLDIHIEKVWEGETPENLFKKIWAVPRKLTHELRMSKGVMLNGEPINWLAPLHTGEHLTILLPEDSDYGVMPADLPLQVVYEDEHVLVANKPAGMDTHPNSSSETDTLANAVAGHYRSRNEIRKVRHVHRLDRDTTGAVLFAKHALIHPILDRMLTERKIKRTYVALADGLLKNEAGHIDLPIGRDRHHATRRRVSPTGQKALTHYRVLEHFPKERLTLIECQLDTGRTHQIRVHMSAIGHPLAGDRLYGGSPRFPRQALHAGMLSLTHPFTEQKLEITADFLDSPAIFEPYAPPFSK